jgi:hypothetical protein
MRRLGTLLSSAAVLALVCGVVADAKPKKPGPKPATQLCELDGDATGGGQVGINVTTYGTLTMINLEGELDDVFIRAGDFSPNGSYTGQGRVLKRQGRLDFSFGVLEPDCRPKEWGEDPGPGTGICQYQLILLNGVYHRKQDEVVFSATDGTEVLLYDTWLDDPLIVEGGTANLLVQFED